jgi:hypothetical protein
VCILRFMLRLGGNMRRAGLGQAMGGRGSLGGGGRDLWWGISFPVSYCLILVPTLPSVSRMRLFPLRIVTILGRISGVRKVVGGFVGGH